MSTKNTLAMTQSGQEKAKGLLLEAWPEDMRKQSVPLELTLSEILGSLMDAVDIHPSTLYTAMSDKISYENLALLLGHGDEEITSSTKISKSFFIEAGKLLQQHLPDLEQVTWQTAADRWLAEHEKPDLAGSPEEQDVVESKQKRKSPEPKVKVPKIEKLPESAKIYRVGEVLKSLKHERIQVTPVVSTSQERIDGRVTISLQFEFENRGVEPKKWQKSQILDSSAAAQAFLKNLPEMLEEVNQGASLANIKAHLKERAGELRNAANRANRLGR